MKKLEKTISRAIEIASPEVLKESKLFLQLIEDLSPELVRERLEIERMYSDEIGMLLFSAYESKCTMVDSVWKEIKKILDQNLGLKEQKQEYFVQLFYHSFVDNITNEGNFGNDCLNLLDKDDYYKAGKTQTDSNYYKTVKTQKDNSYYKQDEKKTVQYDSYQPIQKNKNMTNGGTISKTTLFGGVIAVLCVVLVAVSLKYLGGRKDSLSAGGAEVTQLESTTKANTETTEEQTFPDNVVYNPDNGHHYAVYDYTDYNLYEDFDAWEQFCEDRGGYLAVIENQEENDFIYQYLRDSGLTLAFFGYTDQNSEGKWTWVNGRHSNYENWAYGQPNNGSTTKGKKSENYAQFFKDTADGTWNDSQIAVNTYKFICEWDY